MCVFWLPDYCVCKLISRLELDREGACLDWICSLTTLYCDYLWRPGLTYHVPRAKSGLLPVSVQLQFSNLGHGSFPDAILLGCCSMAWRWGLKTETPWETFLHLPCPSDYVPAQSHLAGLCHCHLQKLLHFSYLFKTCWY